MISAVTAVFFVSGHGFGHASRQVEIINALGLRRPDLRIVIRSAVQPGLLARTLSVPYTLRPGVCDTGIVQATSVSHDDTATVNAARTFYESFETRVDEEVAGLATDAVRLVVGDIPPLAFPVARRLGVPSVAIGNFTWDWIYETHPGFDRLASHLATIRAAYAEATQALQLPFAGGFEIFPHRVELPLVGRRATQPRAAARRHFGLPGRGPVVLLSFGGYGLPSLDLGRVDALPGWTVVTTDRIVERPARLPASVVYLAEREFLGGRFRYEDLVACCDVVMTKPGYGIIAECIANGTALLYTSRGVFREYAVLVEAMPKYLRSRFISQDDLFAGRWREALDAVVAQPPPPECLPVDGADVAAEALARMV